MLDTVELGSEVGRLQDLDAAQWLGGVDDLSSVPIFFGVRHMIPIFVTLVCLCRNRPFPYVGSALLLPAVRAWPSTRVPSIGLTLPPGRLLGSRTGRAI